jgi:hypothetical protein
MATQTVSHVIVFPQSVPAVVEVISQVELELILSLRARLTKLEEEASAAETSLKTRLEAGASVESGDHTATLKESYRRNVAWKAVVVRLAERLKMNGEAYARRVLSATKPTRHVNVVIESVTQ